MSKDRYYSAERNGMKVTSNVKAGTKCEQQSKKLNAFII